MKLVALEPSYRVTRKSKLNDEIQIITAAYVQFSIAFWLMTVDKSSSEFRSVPAMTNAPQCKKKGGLSVGVGKSMIFFGVGL